MISIEISMDCMLILMFHANTMGDMKQGYECQSKGLATILLKPFDVFNPLNISLGWSCAAKSAVKGN